MSSRLQSLFAGALERAPEAREAFLVRECAGDAALLAQLRGLLDTDARLAGTTARPVALGLGEILAATAPGAALSGLRVGPFELREELGRGGMGCVYRAERVDGSVAQQVAIKFVRRELLDANTLRRFQLERQLLASLDHPNIARLLDASALEDGTPYYVMEYVAGEPITAHATRAGLPLRERVALLRTVCGAVAHAHRALIVHRDLKPGNILVTDCGVPKLLDFGIAKPLYAAQEATGTAERFFSPHYAAPEQLAGAGVGVACDVYALGLLLYELLAGAPPFDFGGLSAGQVERLVREVPPRAPSALAGDPALRGDLDSIVLRCLRKAPAERYASVEWLEADLGNWLEGRPVEARGGQLAYRARKFVGRHRVAAGVAAGAALALAAAGVTLLRQNARLTVERDRAQYALDLLRNAFTAADPARTAGADVTARQILGAARAELEPAYDARPDLYAALAGTLADVEMKLGVSAEAAALAERARDAALRARAPEQVRALALLRADALTDAGKLPEAQAALDEAATLGWSGTPEWQLLHARQLCLTGKRKEAIPLLRATLAQIAALPPSVELGTGVRWQLAEAYRIDSDYAQGVATLDATLAWQRGALPESHPWIVRTRLRRIDQLRRLGQKDIAMSEAEYVAAEIDKVYGPDTVFAALAHNSLGSALEEHGKLEPAIEQFRVALRAWHKSVGADHPNAIRTGYNLAHALGTDPARAAEAEQMYRQTIDAGVRRLGTDNGLVAFFRLSFAQFLLDAHRAEEALRVLTGTEAVAALPNISDGNREEYYKMLRRATADFECDAATPLCAEAARLLAAK